MEPTKSQRYASSGLSLEKLLATPSAKQATHAATTQKTIVNMNHLGGPIGRWSAKKIRSLPPTSILTSNNLTKMINPERKKGARGNKDFSERLAHKKPKPIPRKLPIRTKFEKYAKYTMLAPNQRIKASSTKSRRKAEMVSLKRTPFIDVVSPISLASFNVLLCTVMFGIMSIDLKRQYCVSRHCS